ncbi:endonuclease/exonuclease/phosphatase family protein [Flavobacterium sp. HSC-61S13]|uniref:endonuclease/exonuclease/phosphatase family protein n=1 Tax=Flavobacterium sp. HSC-61S13 TaxID=2910963 RepID=UPI0020A07B51|nr:endonuclease/exonuclease/phosphatase family protein [Flavobacterium sp. HSC-61S13]MCP1996765.1 endonuclease/exonuclease/phosphatase family metal-dependent hydrolase [Flavobacterium sp. HSC-61S13]
MRYLFLFLLFFNLSQAQIKISSWNLKNFGKSKSDNQILFIAQTLKDTDIIAIQEVVAGYGGPQAVARLAEELNRTGSKWDYAISDPTDSSLYRSERYAYLWKTNQVKLQGRPFLDHFFKDVIEREPFIIRFKYQQSIFTLINFHAVPKKHQPEREIKYFKHYPKYYKTNHLIVLGDFNCPETHSVFNPLKKLGYQPAFVNQKTSLRQKCIEDDCLASAYDNFIAHPDYIEIKKSEAVHFYRSFNSLEEARSLSDHLPITIEIEL